MSTLNIILAANPEFKFVRVQFNNSPKVYTYKTVLAIEVDDTVVVDTPTSGLTCAKVVEVAKLEEVDLDRYDYKWIVQKVDLAHYEQVVEMSAQVKKTINDSRRAKIVKEAKQALVDNLGEDVVTQVEKLVRL